MTLAFALAKLGLHVFPLAAKNQPITRHGHLDATTDPDLILEWWSEHPRAWVGVHCGASGINALDLDRKDMRDGFEALELQWLETPDTFSYETQNNGEHKIYAAPEGVPLNGVKDYRGWSGVDRKAGSSYVVWYGPAPTSRDEFTPAPAWLCDPARTHVGSSFEGGLDEWLDRLPEGDPDGAVLAAILRIPKSEFGHNVLIERQYEFVRLASEGHPGIPQALDALRTEWLRPPYDTDDYAYEFDAALAGAVGKAGAEDERIAALPNYADTLTSLHSGFDAEILFGSKRDKAHYFAVLRALVGTGLSDDQIAALAWSAPSIRGWTREWGIDYLYAQIAEARAKLVVGENPALELDVTSHNPGDLSLLSDEERTASDEYPTFVDRYVEIARRRSPLLNEPYHRMNAWTILSLGFGMFAFIPMTETRKMGMNLSQIGLGDSSSGKSDSLTWRDSVLREFFVGDPGYDIGSDVSLEALQEYLIKRDGLQAFFNADEAAVVFIQMTKDGSYLGGLESSLTKYYEGYVPPVHKKSAKDISGKSALVSFNIAMFGTPDKVTDVLTEEMFDSGFLARFLWTQGDPAQDISAEDTESEATEMAARAEYDPAARGLATELMGTRQLIGPGRHPVLSADGVLRRIGKARDDMKRIIRDHPRNKILSPSVRRLGDSIRKTAALLALSDGSTTVEMWHAVSAIKEAERWLRDLIIASDQVVGSKFQRECDNIERFVLSQGGGVTSSKLFHAFRHYEPRDFMARLESLRSQDRLVLSSDEKTYTINRKVG
jgi:hypothetical protein